MTVEIKKIFEDEQMQKDFEMFCQSPLFLERDIVYNEFLEKMDEYYKKDPEYLERTQHKAALEENINRISILRQEIEAFENTGNYKKQLSLQKELKEALEENQIIADNTPLYSLNVYGNNSKLLRNANNVVTSHVTKISREYSKKINVLLNSIIELNKVYTKEVGYFGNKLYSYSTENNLDLNTPKITPRHLLGNKIKEIENLYL